MADFQVAFNFDTRTATVQVDGAIAPGGSEIIGKFSHGPTDEEFGYHADLSHVLYQHVRDILYKVSNVDGSVATSDLQWPDNITDMAKVTIIDETYVRSTGVEFGATSYDISLATGAFHPVFTVSPAGATKKDVKLVSADSLIAEVDKTGAIVPKKIGTTTVEITVLDSGMTDSVTINVTA
jgi:hypothetical protein